MDEGFDHFDFFLHKVFFGKDFCKHGIWSFVFQKLGFSDLLWHSCIVALNISIHLCFMTHTHQNRTTHKDNNVTLWYFWSNAPLCSWQSSDQLCFMHQCSMTKVHRRGKNCISAPHWSWYIRHALWLVHKCSIKVETN